MSKLFRIVALAVAITALAAASAEATTGPLMIKSASPFGTVSNTAAITGGTFSNLGSLIFTAGAGATLSCTSIVIRVTTVSTTTITGHGATTGCVYSVSGTTLGAATVNAFCTTDFSFTGAVFNNSTGATSGGTLSAASCGATASIPSIGCTIDGTAQTLGNGISAQNITSTGASDASASPWGAKLVANVSGITYTATMTAGGSCGGISEHGTGSGNGAIAGKNIWGSL